MHFFFLNTKFQVSFLKNFAAFLSSTANQNFDKEGSRINETPCYESYSGLHTICEPQQNMDEMKVLLKKIVSSQNITKTVLHTIRWSSKISCLSLLLRFAQKIPLSLSWRPFAYGNKTNRVLRNATKHLPHTIRVAYQFHCFIPVSFWFVNSV